VALKSVAQVRMVGRSSFRMSYHYLNVNGHGVDGERDACATVETAMPSSSMPASAPAERPASHVD
jgi:hypothetical protein